MFHSITGHRTDGRVRQQAGGRSVGIRATAISASLGVALLLGASPAGTVLAAGGAQGAAKPGGDPTPSVGAAVPQAADPSAPAGIAIGDAQNQVVVHFRDRAAFLTDTAHRDVGQVIDENSDMNSKLLRVRDVPGAIRGLQQNPNVLFAEVNSPAQLAQNPNDPYYPSQWHLGSWGTTHGSNLQGAWDLTTGYKGAKIVIVDTGLDYTHPDLAGKNPTGYNFAEGSYNFWDCNGHGTEVAGTAAAVTNNALGVAGVDGWAGIYVAKIYSGCTGTGTTTWLIAKAISESSAWPGTQVINISTVFYSYSAEVDSAVQTARSRNVVVVAAAGNDNTNVAAYPAALRGVLAVAATDQSGARASFSNWGSNDVDVAAPGVGICTTRTGYLGGGYTCVNGTSFASPLVAGIAMLVRSRYPSDNEASITSRIIAASYNPELGCWKCYSNNYGFGVVNAYYAVR
jgi:thermitase